MMRAPMRILRKGSKGWRMPPGVVYVGRPSRWGNPFFHDGSGFKQALPAVARYGPNRREAIELRRIEQLVLMFENKLRAGKLDVDVDDVRRELRGRDLACWCRLDKPCHADALLRIANE